MNRIILIGNGFDLAHGLKTSYKDFINNFWINEIQKSYDMQFLKTEVSDGKAYYIFEDEFVVAELKDFIDASDKKNIDIFRRNIIQYKNKFLRTIEMELYEKKWCDIENLYYKEFKRCLNLKKNENDDYSIKQLNDDFEAIRKKLEEYLTEQTIILPNKIPDIEQHLKRIKPFDTANKSYAKTLFLNFNYTKTETLYSGANDKIIHIHGELNNKDNSIIFGYGDELDDDYKDIEKQDNKEFQENLKFISYLKTKNYEDLLNFMNKDDYEIYIFGHSCGNSDRTLLNFLFEEGCLKQCRKIRIFYHEDANGKSNYTDIIKDISKQFNKKSRLRELVVKAKPLKKPDVKPKKKLWEELEDNMVDVIVDKNCPAYLAIDDTISSKKDLDEDFKISKFLVTQDLWESIMGKNKLAFPAEKNPAESVSWDDICKKTGFLDKLNKISGKQYRLPTEAEWEYAARGGIKSNNYEYAGCNLEEELKYYAWYEKNSNISTHPVGQLHPNELGLYDMSGNVWEWCEDSEGSARVLRGGSWLNGARSVRVSDRNGGDPDGRCCNYGFRLALSSN